MNSTHQNTIRNPYQLPIRLSPFLWIGLILFQGIIFCIEPIFAAAILISILFAGIFVLAAVSNTRWALGIILVVALMVPMRAYMLKIASFTIFDFCSLLILSLLFILWTLSAYKEKPIISPTPLDKWMIALAGLAIFNCIFSKDVNFTIHAWQHILIPGPLIFFLVYHNFTNGEQIRKVFFIILVIMGITGVYLIIEHMLKYNIVYHYLFLGHNKFYHPGVLTFRSLGFCGQMNITGVTITIVLPFFILGLQQAATSTKRFLWGIASLVLAFGAVSTYSRGTLVALFIAIIFMSVRSWRSFYLSLLVLIIVFAIVFNVGLFNQILFRLDPRFLMNDPSLWHRILMHYTCTNIFLDHPIIGAGLSSAFKLYVQYKHPLDTLGYGVVDNQFLTILYGTGIVGTIIILGLLIKIPVYIYRHNRKNQPLLMKWFRRTACISILAFFINSLTVDTFDWVYTNLPFWFIVALLMRLVTLPNTEIAKFFRIYGYSETAPELQPVKKPPINNLEG